MVIEQQKKMFAIKRVPRFIVINNFGDSGENTAEGGFVDKISINLI